MCSIRLLFKLLLGLSTFIVTFSCNSAEDLKFPQFYTARGIIHAPAYRAQENTLDAILAIKKWNLDHPVTKQIQGCEVNIVVIKPKTPGSAPAIVCSHDENLKDLTGLDLNLHDLSRQQIQNLQIKQNLNGVDYGTSRPFAFLEEVLDGVMKDQPFMLWLGVKDRDYQPSEKITESYTAVELIKSLKQWQIKFLRERNINIFNYIIISSTNPYILEELLKAQKKYQVEGIIIFADYADFRLPTIIWEKFFEFGGYEKIYHMTPKWVSLQDKFITKDRIKQYHRKGVNVICWGKCDESSPYFHRVDVALTSL